jgi:hypothetical protein
MIAPIDKVRGEGNCGRATDRGEEAGASAARLRTETSYKAGVARRVGTTPQSRSQTVTQVNGELVQRQITFLSGETCTDGLRAVAAPRSKACLKARNGPAKAGSGGAGVSRGRSTDPRRPIETGRTKR